jgi:hypothetical protein
MKYQGSCHCGRIAFTLDAEVSEAIDCNCSMCRRRGALLAAFPRSALTLTTHCGVSPFSEGKSRDGDKTVMVNLRCLPEVNLAALKITSFDGASY